MTTLTRMIRLFRLNSMTSMARQTILHAMIRLCGQTRPSRLPRMGSMGSMLSIQDVPRVLELEGGEILAIPTRIENEIRQGLIHCDQEGHGRNDGGGNVQILERAVCV